MHSLGFFCIYFVQLLRFFYLSKILMHVRACACVRACMCARTHAHTGNRSKIRSMFVFFYTCTIFVYMFVWLQMRVCVYIWRYVSASICVRVCVCIHDCVLWVLFCISCFSLFPLSLFLPLSLSLPFFPLSAAPSPTTLQVGFLTLNRQPWDRLSNA